LSVAGNAAAEHTQQTTQRTGEEVRDQPATSTPGNWRMPG